MKPSTAMRVGAFLCAVGVAGLLLTQAAWVAAVSSARGAPHGRPPAAVAPRHPGVRPRPAV
jgi:hypothetical protein